ncbi:phosphonopyruvate decarboxylase-related protein [Desulfovibrio sp. X2]|uniref:cofactor-independent phosphoglycerate mutase n=1 Tax=Desulfovibrio sp. X2 TaxID=941449 RepID=UPI0003587E2F|nr:cofactor-independent phosphoglycerate mutase [Desulfovibrio sp. X2]EPR41742.1 phosphonopyruvate decarboxylase-related protein [Desulfovibrio sp. X2]
MKFVALIADGMGDWPVESLGGRTPLAAARTPAMDALAASGLVGTCRTVPEGMAPGSDVANMALLGFDPARHHTGRGPIEAAAQGLEAGDDDLIWRMNLVTVENFGPDGTMRDYSAGHIATPKAAAIVAALKERLDDATFTMHAGVQYRHLLVQRDAAAGSDAGLCPRPPHDILDRPIAQDLAEYAKNPALSRLVGEAAGLLADGMGGAIDCGAANAVWPWGQGRPLRLPRFEDAFGLKGAVISAVDLVKGLGRASGMEVIDVPGATGLLDTNYEGKVDAALEFLKRGDFVFVHLEGPDECGHGGDAAAKTESVRRFDSRVVAPMIRALADEDVVFLVTCDHLTPIALRTHHGDPVPFLLSWRGCPTPSGLAAFTEETAASTGLRVEPGHTLLAWALAQAGAAGR